jgi:hypothetical protein
MFEFNHTFHIITENHLTQIFDRPLLMELNSFLSHTCGVSLAKFNSQSISHTDLFINNPTHSEVFTVSLVNATIAPSANRTK